MKDVLTGKQFADLKTLTDIFAVARELEEADKMGKVPKKLEGKIVATVFYETSTRTRMSFESAALKLGASVVSMPDPKTSSASKGEDLEDSSKIIANYCDILVLRHPANGAAEEAANAVDVPVINAGDGYNEHPTQALLDLYAIQKEIGKIDGIKIAFLADCRYQRNVHSLVPLFSVFPNIEIYFIGPKELQLPQIYKDELIKSGVKFHELEKVDEILPEVDVLYVARVFKERFEDVNEYERLKKSFFVDKNTLSKMKEKSVVLHVMPRIFEIDKEVDKDPRAGYFRQAKGGLYIRMALLLYSLSV
jgi:aspartate carbamoyltransferase catalytic subunit